MKKNKQVAANIFLKIVALLLLSLPLFFGTGSCSGDDDEDTEPQFDRPNIVGVWELKSATFLEAVDLDGPGPLQPTTDAKQVLYDIFDFYGSCSSLEEILLGFEDYDNSNFEISNFSNVEALNAVCPEGAGVTSQIAAYDLTYDGNVPIDIWLLRNEILDPLELFDWTDTFFFLIKQYDCPGNFCKTLSGYSEGLISSLPEPKPNLTFDFVLERVSE